MAHRPDQQPDRPDGAGLDLQRLLGDAVADVTPHDRLGEIRRRTSHVPRRAGRRWPLVVLGAGVATAAVVGGVAWIGGLGLPDTDDDPATSGDREQAAVAAYFVGGTPRGDRLFREFQAISPEDEEAPLALAALRLLETDAGPLDPDYSTAWPDGSFLAVSVTDEVIEVRLADGIESLPAVPAAQQAVFTVQAALGSALPVEFTTSGHTLVVDGGAQVGHDTSRLAAVNITDPVEGHSVDDLLTVRGVVSLAGPAPEEVVWELQALDDSTEVVASGSAAVAVETRAWEQTTSIADVPSGTYRLVARVPLPGAAPGAVATDTRTLTVR
ncbi:MAG TPA: hypothetical protein VNS46_14070 [Nocardioides sp.]|nr:hypothetical protein [Nocardioides sp.]